MLPKYVFFQFTFQALESINELPWFHGIHWSAMFRYMYGKYLNAKENFSDTGIIITSHDTAIKSYNKGDWINVGVALPYLELKRFKKVIKNNFKTHKLHGHFIPDQTISLKSIRCRISGRIWPDRKPEVLTPKHIKNLTVILSRQSSFQIRIITPLRLKRPSEHRITNHRFYDTDYFLNYPDNSKHFLSNFLLPKNKSEYDKLQISIENYFVKWIDIPYQNKQKTLGGIFGTLHITKKGQLPIGFLKRIIIGQWFGIGRNTSLGFGEYVIPEIENFSPIRPLRRHRTLLSRALNYSKLSTILDNMDGTQPGLDGIAASSVKLIKRQALTSLINSVRHNEYTPGPLLHISIEKHDGGERQLQIANVTDRILQKSVHKILLNTIDKLLTPHSYAYRPGQGREKALRQYQNLSKLGFKYCIKTDIEAFFDQIDLKKLFGLLEALFYNDPIIDIIKQWYNYPNKKTGLYQGNPLSPLLSNLFLDVFDRNLESKDVKLIRFSDDFLVMYKKAEQKTEIMSKIKEILSKIKLKLKQNKTLEIDSSTSFVFLGYHLKNGKRTKQKSKQLEDVQNQQVSNVKPEDKPWKELFRREWKSGKYIYITSKIYRVHLQNNNLVLTDSNNKSHYISWASIKHIIVIGKQRLTGAVFSKAIHEKVPISFQQLLGSPHTANLTISTVPSPGNLVGIQYRTFADAESRLLWAKKVITAKINNQFVVLKKRGNKDLPPLKTITQNIKSCIDLDELRGLEGSYSKTYYKLFAKHTAPFKFEHRIYHPPNNEVNAMLSFGYTLIYNRLNAALLRVGLDTRIGFMHQGRGKHAALASDLMEELRYLADRVVLSLIKLKIINKTHFYKPSNLPFKAIYLQGEGTKLFIQRFEDTMGSRFLFPKTQSIISYNEYLDEVAENVAVNLRMGIPYEPRLVK